MWPSFGYFSTNFRKQRLSRSSGSWSIKWLRYHAMTLDSETSTFSWFLEKGMHDWNRGIQKTFSHFLIVLSDRVVVIKHRWFGQWMRDISLHLSSVLSQNSWHPIATLKAYLVLKAFFSGRNKILTPIWLMRYFQNF